MTTAFDYTEKEPRGQSIVADGPLDGVATVEDDRVRRMSVIPGFAEVTDGAIAGTEIEKRMGIIEGFKLYPKAVGWSILLSTAIVMEGYDIALLSSFYEFPPFAKKFGNPVGDGTYQLTPAWQAGLSNGANVGEILGLFVTGIIADRFGYRYTMIGSLSLVICFIFLPYFAQNVETLLVGEILCGIPWGVFQTCMLIFSPSLSDMLIRLVTTTYAAEVTPVPLRCYLTTYVNLCWVMGQFIASGVLRGLLPTGTPAQIANAPESTFRIAFAIQWMWPVPLIIGCFLAPESPWWCVRKGNIEGARHSVRRLTSAKRDPNFNVDDTVAMMVHTNELEKDISTGTSYWDCFKGVDLRRTEITSITWGIQNFCGSTFMVSLPPSH